MSKNISRSAELRIGIFFITSGPDVTTIYRFRCESAVCMFAPYSRAGAREVILNDSAEQPVHQRSFIKISLGAYTIYRNPKRAKFLLYFSMNYRDFSVKPKLIILLFLAVKLSLSISLFQKIGFS